MPAPGRGHGHTDPLIPLDSTHGHYLSGSHSWVSIRLIAATLTATCLVAEHRAPCAASVASRCAGPLPHALILRGRRARCRAPVRTLRYQRRRLLELTLVERASPPVNRPDSTGSRYSRGPIPPLCQTIDEPGSIIGAPHVAVPTPVSATASSFFHSQLIDTIRINLLTMVCHYDRYGGRRKGWSKSPSLGSVSIGWSTGGVGRWSTIC